MAIMSTEFSDIIAIIALGISLILSFFEVQRRWRGLQLRIRGISLINATNDALYLLVDRSIVNPSSIPKTIFRIDFKPTDNFEISAVPGKQDFEKALVTYQTPGTIQSAIQVRLEDTVSFPLDIEPHHSKGVYFAISVSPITIPAPVSKRKFASLLAKDYREKRIASVDLVGPV